MISKSTVISSLFWKFMERAGVQVMQFIVSIVLARLLAPEEFGLIAMVMIVIAIADVFVQSGLNTALIQKKDADDLDFSSVFFASLALATIVYVIIFFSAPFIANFYGQSSLVPVIRVISITLFLGVFNSIQGAYIARHMLFKKLFFRSTGAIIPSGLIGIVLAFLGYGIWALVMQQLANIFFAVIIMWFSVPWRPHLQLSLTRLKVLFNFGWKLLVSSLLDTVYTKLRGLIIAKAFTPAELAYYDRGDHFPYLVVNNINNSIQSVMLPSFSAIQDDKPQLKRLMRRAIVTSSFVVTPMMAGLAAMAQTIIQLLLGDKWAPSAPFIQAYCFIYCFYPIHTSNLSAINAMGRSDIFLKLEVIKKIVGVTCLITSLFIFRSAIGIAYGAIISCLFSAFINAFPNKKLLNYGYFEQIKDISPSMVLSTIMGVCVYYLGQFDLPLYCSLIAQVISGLTIYLGLAKLLHFECFEYIINIIRDLKNGK